MYTYIRYTPNLGLIIAASVREREQGRFRGSSEGAGRAVSIRGHQRYTQSVLIQSEGGW